MNDYNFHRFSFPPHDKTETWLNKVSDKKGHLWNLIQHITQFNSTPDGQYWNQIHYILCSQRWRSAIQSAKIRLGADCGSDHKLLIAKFRLKLKEVGKTTRPFRYEPKSNPLRLYRGSEK